MKKVSKILSDEHRFLIDAIIARFKGAITVWEILAWLENFKEAEYLVALEVLSKVEYVSESEIVEKLGEGLEEICLKMPNHQIAIHPCGDYGKSGTLMIYYLKKTPAYEKYKDQITFYESYQKIKWERKSGAFSNKTVFVILDDFLGSGESFEKYYRTFIQEQIQNSAIVARFVLVIFFLKKALKYITETILHGFEIIGEERFPAFDSRSSVFGYRFTMRRVREFCYFYGKELFSIVDLETRMEEKHPLGYKNSQALVVFCYGPPNNSLPILWSTKALWVPIIPRYYGTRISIAKQKRKEIAYELGLLRQTKLKNVLISGQGKKWDMRTYSFATNVDFAIFAIIKMQRQRVLVPVICQSLGISKKDYDAYIQEGISRKLFEPGGILSAYGLRLYQDCLKNLTRIKRNDNFTDSTLVESVIYLPEKFNGRS